MFAFLPKLFLAYFPIVKPSNVKKPLIILNIKEGSRLSILIPIPVIKLSILTNIASANNVIVFSFFSDKSSFLRSIISFMDKIRNIIPSNLFDDIVNIFIIFEPIILPIIGKIKWNNDTPSIYVINFLLSSIIIPKYKDNENVSILNAIAIISKLIIFKISPNYIYDILFSFIIFK